MFSGNDSQVWTRRRQAKALSISVLSHLLALLGLLIHGSYRLAELDAPFKAIAFIADPMIWDDVQRASIKERDTAASGPNNATRGGIISEQERPQPTAPEPPPPPISTEENREQPLQAEIPALPEQDPAAYNLERFGLTEGAIPSPFGLPAYGSAFGWRGHEGGAGGSSAWGSGTTGTGKGGGLPGPAGGDGIRERVIGTDTGPILAKMNPPVYPKYARRMGREGKVVLSILIDKSGRLIEARVLERAGHGFDEAALEAVRSWTFKPALENGIPVACRARMAIRFQLNDDT